MKVALFVEGGAAPVQNRRNPPLQKIWDQLTRALQCEAIALLVPISKRNLVAMDPAEPKSSGAGEALDQLMARHLDQTPFDAAIVAWDLVPAWDPDVKPCRWQETLSLYRLLGESTALPKPWAASARHRHQQLARRSRPSARDRPHRLGPHEVVAVCMDSMFESLLFQREQHVFRAIGTSRRPRDWPTQGWGRALRPDAEILVPLVNALRSGPRKAVAADRQDDPRRRTLRQGPVARVPPAPPARRSRGPRARARASDLPPPERVPRAAIAGILPGPPVDTPPPARTRRSAYIVGPLYDWAFFLLPPVAALVLGIAVSGSRLADEPFLWSDQHVTPTSLALGIFIQAHLVLVLFRSHANRTVLRQHPYRFTLVPGLLLMAMLVSPVLAVGCSVLATFWDVYHSGAQTFGFGRIYDAKRGNDPHEGRWLDFTVNQLLYAGPILAGATMMDHFEDFMEFEAVEVALFTRIPALMAGHHAVVARVVVAGGTALLAYYVWAQWRMARRGRAVSWQKVYLLASTGLVSVYTWGLNTWGEAFLIMNTFHALQYFGIVWATERDNLRRLLRLHRVPGGAMLTWWLFVGSAVGYGIAVEAWADGRSITWWSVTIVVSLMHFWYDGFVWSVRKSRKA